MIDRQRRARAAREMAGFSVAEVALRLGKSKSTIHAWEADFGASPRRPEDLVALCRLYGITIDWYLEGREPIFRYDSPENEALCPHVQQIIDCLPRLNGEQRAAVAQVVKVMVKG